jgi:DNA polymerase-3 subunit gamma/tau
MSADAGDIAELASVLTPEQVQLYYQIATVGRSELGLAPDEYAGFTMTLLRMLAFYPSTEGLTLIPQNRPAPSLRDHAKSSQQEGATSQKDTAVLRQSAPALHTQDAQIPTLSIAASPPALKIDALAIAPVLDTPASATPAAVQHMPMSDRHSADLKSPPSLCVQGEEISAPVPQNTASVPLENTAQWPLLVPKLKLRGLTEQLAANSELIHIEDATLTLRVPLPQLAQKHCVEKLQSALTLHFGRTLIIKTEIGVANCTAAQDIAKAQIQRQEEALESIQKNPVVQDLQRLLDASLVPGSVRAI